MSNIPLPPSLQSLVQNGSISINEFMIDTKKELGFGYTSVVYEAINIKTNEKVAAKIIDKLCINQSTLNLVHNEIKALRTLTHPNILKLHATHETNDVLVLFLELADGGDLLRHTQTHIIPEKMARSLFIQIIDALRYAHKNNVIHRDIKLENMLLRAKPGTNEFHVLVSDWGFCGFVSDTDKYLVQSCGSPQYAAPELILGNKYLGELVDVWSLGVLLYTMNTGRFPFFHDDINEVYHRIHNHRQTYSTILPLSKNLIELIDAMLSKQPDTRPTIADIHGYAWTLGK